MTNPQLYGLDTAQFNMIVTATNTAIADMTQLNNSVSMVADQVGSANQSDSGRRFNSQLATWNEDFQRIQALLNDLNNKAINLRNISQAHDADATQRSAAGT